MPKRSGLYLGLLILGVALISWLFQDGVPLSDRVPEVAANIAGPPTQTQLLRAELKTEKIPSVSKLYASQISANDPSVPYVQEAADTKNNVHRNLSNQKKYSEPQSDEERPPNEVSATELIDPRSVIGRPMPMSDSVLMDCDNHSQENCEYSLRPLRQLAQEPRDLSWAPKAEAQIEEFIQAYENPLTIRAIECRQTGCIAEVASHYGRFRIVPSPAFDKLAFENRLIPRSVTLDGLEIDQSTGEKITITYWRFERGTSTASQ